MNVVESVVVCLSSTHQSSFFSFFFFQVADAPQQVLRLSRSRSSTQHLDTKTEALVLMVFLECGYKLVVEDISSRLPAVAPVLSPLHELFSSSFPKQPADEMLFALHADVACVRFG